MGEMGAEWQAGGRGREGGIGGGGGEGARAPAIGKAPQRHLPAGLRRNVKPNRLQVKDRRGIHSILSQGLNSPLSAWLLAKLCLSACLCLL